MLASLAQQVAGVSLRFHHIAELAGVGASLSIALFLLYLFRRRRDLAFAGAPMPRLPCSRLPESSAGEYG